MLDPSRPLDKSCRYLLFIGEVPGDELLNSETVLPWYPGEMPVRYLNQLLVRSGTDSPEVAHHALQAKGGENYGKHE